MRNIALATTIVISLSAPALAQKAEIDANNAKWLELFNKGDFSGIASLSSADAIAARGDHFATDITQLQAPIA